MKRLLLLSLVFLFIACDKEPPISEEKFVEIYSSILIMRDTSNLTNNQIKDSVLTRFSVSSEEYDSMVNFYNAEPERWNLFFEKAEAFIDSLKTSKSEKL